MNSNTTFIFYFYCRLCFWGILNKLGYQQVLGTSYCFRIIMGEPKGTPREPRENPCRIPLKYLQALTNREFSYCRILTAHAYEYNINVPQALQQP
jgi:hypothetical protein